MRLWLGKSLMRLGWSILLPKHRYGGLIVNPNGGKWQPVKL